MDKLKALEEKIQKLKEKREQIQTWHTAPYSAKIKTLKRLNKQITKAEEQRYRRMHRLEITSPTAKKARTRTLIEVGSLCENAGVLKSFGIILGKNLQKDPEMQKPTAALFKEFVRLSETR
ncbi:MAG: hypothetical protein K2X02_08930 [Alphaproteobacteria bacterium]|jgi:hypothetical protein|nr:hypothetical protein [Alphaproteobacteria bacterium]